MKPMRVRAARRRALFAGVLLSCASAGAAERTWTDAELRAPGAADAFFGAVAAENGVAAAERLLSRGAPLLAEPEGRRRAYLLLSRLRETMGSFSSAAESYLAVDEKLEAARCLIAVNEGARALALIDELLSAGPDAESASRGMLLKAYARAFRREGEAEGLLRFMLDDPARRADRPALLFLLNRLYGNAEAAKMLVRDHPDSMEARILGGEASLAAAPHWLLAAERNALAAADVKAQEAAPEKEESSDGPLSLQVGLFRREDNARVLSGRLSAAGFSPAVSERSVGGDRYWAVTVPPGTDSADTIMRLKHAGFEAFPLF